MTRCLMDIGHILYAKKKLANIQSSSVTEQARLI